MSAQPASTRNANRVLIIAYHFPPFAVSSGIQRTLSFVRHLPAHGWNPVVLAPHPKSYERINEAQLRSIPASVPMVRPFAPDAARHFAIGGRYWQRLGIPDRYRAWWLTAVPAGLRMIRKHSINAIFTTYPIATAHTIGATLARLTGLPWVADFRDPMVEHIERINETFPKDPVLRAARLRIEALAAMRASRLVFCTNAARDIVARRYPNVPVERLRVISNGFDELEFLEAERLLTSAPQPLPAPTRRVLLHSGTIYLGADRDPTALFQALKSLHERGSIEAGNFELRLRDPSNPERIAQKAAEHGLASLVTVLPPLSYHNALAEMMQVDGLLVLQGFTSNPAVPAKLYEYARAQRPILGLVDSEGETFATLQSMGIDSFADIADANAIEKLLTRWLGAAGPSFGLPARERVAPYEREALTAQLADVLNGLAGS